MNEILAWGPVLWTARVLAFLLLIACTVIAVTGFGLLMAKRIPKPRKVAGMGWQWEFDEAQDQQLKALDARVRELEWAQDVQAEVNQTALAALKRLEEDDVE